MLDPIDPTIVVRVDPERQPGPDPADPNTGTSLPTDGTQVIEPNKEPPPKGEFKPPIHKLPPGDEIA